jgi:hypothetical protein
LLGIANPPISLENLEIWSSIHSGSSSHPFHNHPDSLVSGVYFVRIPEGAGSLVFADSRQTDLQAIVEPTEGKLVLFPG